MAVNSRRLHAVSFLAGFGISSSPAVMSSRPYRVAQAESVSMPSAADDVLRTRCAAR